jgi:hypothetical protein
MERLIPLWDHLRSYLGMVALLAIGLPAVVLLLTLLADSSRPLPKQASDGGGESGDVVHQDRPDGRRSGGSGEEEKVRPLGRRDEDGTPDGSSGADRTDPTQQIVRDQGGAVGGQDPPNVVGAPATSAATVVPASTAKPASVSASTPPTTYAIAPTTAPPTASASTPADAATTANPEPASAPEPAAPANVTPISEPVEVPADGVRGTVSDPQLYGAPE